MERGASGVRKGEGGAVGLDFAQVDMDVVGPLQMLSNVWSLEIPQLEEKSAFIRKGVSEGGGRVVSAHILTRFVCVCVYVCLCVCFHPLPPGGQGVQHCCICLFFLLYWVSKKMGCWCSWWWRWYARGHHHHGQVGERALFDCLDNGVHYPNGGICGGRCTRVLPFPSQKQVCVLIRFLCVPAAPIPSCVPQFL